MSEHKYWRHRWSPQHVTTVDTTGTINAPQWESVHVLTDSELAARVTPTREQLATEIAKHFRIGDEVDGGYYCGCGEGDYRDANHVADAVLALIAGLTEGSE